MFTYFTFPNYISFKFLCLFYICWCCLSFFSWNYISFKNLGNNLKQHRVEVFLAHPWHTALSLGTRTSGKYAKDAKGTKDALLCRAVEPRPLGHFSKLLFHHQGSLPFSRYLSSLSRDFVLSHFSFSCVFQMVGHQFNSSGKVGISILYNWLFNFYVYYRKGEKGKKCQQYSCQTVNETHQSELEIFKVAL